jgi:hypothetical protein
VYNRQGRNSRGRPDLVGKLLHWVQNGAGLFGSKLKSWGVSHQLGKQAVLLPVGKHSMDRLKREWSRILASPHPAPAPAAAEKALLNRITQLTEAGNRNNVTRTMAYWEIYRKHPELHWAFLAHMVSRNGGWSMTDLQGELLPHLLEQHERKDLFLFLERANALIFQDAYPQLLLYEESKRQGRPLFHLLPQLHISAFMRPVWELFWKEREPVLLTVCLIINEQHYIEGRVVRNGYYQKQVLNTLAFQTQSLLQLNQVVIPYRPDEKSGHRLAGLILEDFSDLKERIGIGKALYGQLFGIPDILEGATAFARQHPHTGSRSDYYTRLYSAVRKSLPGTAYTARLDGCGLMTDAYPLYSPPLHVAWKDHPIDKVERYDWFRTLHAAELLGSVHAPGSTDMTGDACAGLLKIELAVLAAQGLGLDDG